MDNSAKIKLAQGAEHPASVAGGVLSGLQRADGSCLGHAFSCSGKGASNAQRLRREYR